MPTDGDAHQGVRNDLLMITHHLNGTSLIVRYMRCKARLTGV